MFRIRYLPANDAWCVVYGATDILTLDAYEPGKRLFSSREELIEALLAIGLCATSDGRVFNAGE